MPYPILSTILLPALAGAQPHPAPNPIPRSNMPVHGKAADPKCERPLARHVGDVPPPGIRKLGEMPPAKPIYTVLREIDGCPKPVSVPAR
ncbi:hypothetical protein FHT00_000876 [Sphingomonas insulae]|uniref:Uncharacterized protein n=1 Tax=Sphingomonas insulae TaxID=424800 RepID=A0ABN1HSL1_9SPHN|nr:hypothetical protein [Sphingomonas insulae]NIJ28943.1 hypothetical protein [Sphingomonas insulae]